MIIIRGLSLPGYGYSTTRLVAYKATTPTLADDRIDAMWGMAPVYFCLDWTPGLVAGDRPIFIKLFPYLPFFVLTFTDTVLHDMENSSFFVLLFAADGRFQQ
jgi:hypothetical protein